MKETAKCNRAELLAKLQEIVRCNTQDPAEELRLMGKALMEIGEALQGLTPHDARAVLSAVRSLN